MLARMVLLLALLAGLVGCSPPSNEVEAAALPEKVGPNILLVVTDQQNRQAMGCMGERGVQTPNLDRLAEEGVLFRSAYCNDPICSPSRYSFLSGVHATEIGAFKNHIQPRQDLPLLSELLQEMGYYTVSLGKGDLLPSDEGRGFDVDLHHKRFLGRKDSDWYPWFSAQAKAQGIDHKIKYRETQKHHFSTAASLCAIGEVPNELTPEAWVTEQALVAVQEAQERDQPFFVYANFVAPHHPYGPLPEFLDLYDPESLKLPPNFATPEKSPTGLGTSDYESWSEEDWRLVLHHYYAYVSQVDHHIGKLLQGLEELGEAEDTLVIFTSDHGDMAGEFGSLLKGVPFEGSIGVPLILRWPGHLEANRVVDAPVSLIDLAPTVYDALERAPLPHFRGDSLIPLVAGEQNAADRDVFVIDVRAEPFHLAVLREERWKLSITPRKTGELSARFVDLLDDPHELRDRSEDPDVAQEFERMRAKLLAFWERESKFVPSPLPEPISRRDGGQ